VPYAPPPVLRLLPTLTSASDLDAPPDLFAALASPGHLLIALAAAALGSFGTLATTGLLAYSPSRLRQKFADDGLAADDADARTDAVSRHAAEYLLIANLALATSWVLGLWSLGQAFGQGSEAIAMTVYAVVMLWLGGALPASIAQARPEKALLFALPTLRPLWLLLRWPLILPVLATTRLLVAALRVARPEPTDAAEVREQVIAAVADTVTEDELAHEQRTMIGNIIDLEETPASSLMTPRPDIVALAESLTLREAVQKALEHGFSRYPVYRERADEIVGIFYVKDALKRLQAGGGESGRTTLRELVRPVLFVPETTGAAQLLRRFQAGNQHMAIVLDEYGMPVGLVTVEDVLEQIVGDIGDEYDPLPSPTDAEQVRVVEKGRVVELPARTPVAEINRLLGSELPESTDWETVAGLVIAVCNHIPVVDEKVEIAGVEFRVLQADDRRVLRLRATLLAPQPAEGAG
jgi:CBS domain containing-hemolysin-like protein